MPNFQVFKKRMIPLVKQPYLTIQKRGTFSFNKAAHQALGTPEAVELLFDPDEKILGVRAVDPREQHAYPIRNPVGKQESSFIVSGTAFVRYYDIPVGVSYRYPAYLEDGVLCVDLKQEGTEVTSNRNGHRKTTVATS